MLEESKTGFETDKAKYQIQSVNTIIQINENVSP